MNILDSNLTARDQKTVWHPYSQHGLESDFLPVVRAKNAWLELADGQQILDAISSWWVNLHGHAQPAIAAAIYQQALQLEHTLLAGFTHQPAVELAELLINAMQLRGTQLTRCFYTDNGSTAVEAAMKMAFQYHKNRGVDTRTQFIAISNAYHGDTLGCMAVSDRNGFHQQFAKLLPDVSFISADNITELETQLNQQPYHYAALIIEPMVQGAGGMKMHSADFLAHVAALCKQAGVLLICDEVFTGFHRTGPCFAFEHAAIKPDLVCLAKGLTGGFLPLAVTLTTEEIFCAFYSTKMQHAFLHGHSFTANPLACAAAIASWRILHQAQTQQAIINISEKTKQWIKRLSQHKNCVAARFSGTIGAVEKRNLADYQSGTGHKIRAFAIQHGVLLRPLGCVLYAVPPYCTTDSELDHIYQVIELILNQEEF